MTTSVLTASERSIIVPPNYISGLTLSTPGSNTQFSVAPGLASDSTNVDYIYQTPTLTKNTSTWATGNNAGSLDTGTIAASTWYHAHSIKNPASGAVDVLVSLSATSPTLPSGYTLFRRIGSMKTDGSSHWTAFTQNVDEFLWLTPLLDANAVTCSSTAQGITLTVPTGVKVWAKFTSLLNATSQYLMFYSPDRAQPSTGASNASLASNASGNQTAGEFSVRTNTSGQIGVIAANGGAGSYYIGTYGWIDPRGQT